MKITVYDLEADGGPQPMEMWAVDAREAINNGQGRYAYELPSKGGKAKKGKAEPVKYDLKDQGGGAWTITADGADLETGLDEATALRKLEELQAKA